MVGSGGQRVPPTDDPSPVGRAQAASAVAVAANMVALMALRVPLSLPVRGFIRSVAVLSTSCSAAQLSAAGCDGGRAAIAVPGCHGRDRRLRTDLRLDEAGHPRRERMWISTSGKHRNPRSERITR